MENLPPELSDKIIDNFRGDKLALATCSVVCKGWLARSRYHLFSEITLLCSATQQGPYHPFNFIQQLDVDPHMAAYVCSLRIQSERMGRNDLAHFPPLSPVPQGFLSLSTLATLLRKLPKATHLDLHGIFWTVSRNPMELTHPDELAVALLEAGPPCLNVRTLVISCMRTVQRLPAFHILFHLFPRVQVLSLEHSLMHIMFPTDDELFFPPDLRLNSLTVVGDCPVLPMNMIVPHSATRQLIELHSPPDYMLHPVVEDAKDSLQHVSLDIAVHYDFSLLPCTNLHTLRIWSSAKNGDHSEHFGKVLQRILPNCPLTLKHISIELPWNSPLLSRKATLQWARDWSRISIELGRLANLEVLDFSHRLPSGMLTLNNAETQTAIAAGEAFFDVVQSKLHNDLQPLLKFRTVYQG